ncbi:MAG: bifunctional DNA primase/polymerase, partial [Chloroflexota bacterium]
MSELSNPPNLNLLDAATAPTILEAALRYQAQGCTVLPILKGQKKSGLPGWDNLRPTPADLRRYFATGKYGGVAIRPGELSQHLVMIDCDGERVYEAFCAQFPALVETYTERSGSGKGYHLFYQADTLPAPGATKVNRKGIFDTDDLGFEVFFDTGAVVVAPSIHPSGNPYTVYKPLDVSRVDQLDNVTAWAYTLETKQERESNERKAAAPTTPTKAHTGTAAPRNGQIAPDLIIDIEQALGVKSFKGDGWSKPVRCVLARHKHDDSNPAASWNRDKQIYSCLKCGVTDMLAHQVADVLGFDVSSYYEKLPTTIISRKQKAKPIRVRATAQP